MAITKKHYKKQMLLKSVGKLKKTESDVDEIPPLDETFWKNAVIGSPLRKKLISLRLDSDVIDWFKNHGASYQTRMNLVLRTYMEWHNRPRR